MNQSSAAEFWTISVCVASHSAAASTKLDWRRELHLHTQPLSTRTLRDPLAAAASIYRGMTQKSKDGLQTSEKGN